MSILDASIVVELLLQTRQSAEMLIRRDDGLQAPHLVDLEVAHVLRRMVRLGDVTAERAQQALHDLSRMQIERYPHAPLLPRIWELRHRFSAYDAAYVGLAEALPTTLYTRDRRLASTVGHHARIELW